MKKVAYLLLFALMSMKALSQEGFIYNNSQYGVEVKFPSKPELTSKKTPIDKKSEYISQVASLMIVSAGLTYNLAIMEKSNGDMGKVDDLVETYKKTFKASIKREYELFGTKILEYDWTTGGHYMRSKIMIINKVLYQLMVASQSSPTDKDVLPFFNSLKINGTSIRDPFTDPGKFTNFAIDDPTKTKKDTIKQIVYVNSGSNQGYLFERSSDVDKNIPQNSLIKPYRFALIIGNEDYSSHQVDLNSEINVDFARNDASAFKEYAINTLGVPEKNVVFLLDATTGLMNQAFSKMNLIIKNTQGNAEVLVYYAGHGLPDEVTKETYLIPLDISGKNAGDGIRLQNLYAKLTEFPSKRVTVFIDACFSGGARNQGLLAARGIKIRPKDDPLNGNLVVFTASSGEQSSLAYKEKHHGIFTYFLLQKLQESKGSVSYNELSKYIHDNVSLQSVLINDKEQSPQVNVSNSIGSEWEKFDLK